MYRLTEDQKAIVSRARELAVTVLAAHAADVDENAIFPAESMQALADAGFYGLLVPVAQGGMGQSLRVLAAVLDELAQQCASTAMVFMMHNAGVNCYLSDTVKFDAVLRQAAAGKHLSTLAFSEKGSRSQFWAPVSQAVDSGNGVILSAEKSWVTSAGYADGIVSSCVAADITTNIPLLLRSRCTVRGSQTFGSARATPWPPPIQIREMSLLQRRHDEA